MTLASDPTCTPDAEKEVFDQFDAMVDLDPGHYLAHLYSRPRDREVSVAVANPLMTNGGPILAHVTLEWR